MKNIKSFFLLSIFISLISCAEDNDNNREDQKSEEVVPAVVEEVIDTIPMTVVQLIILGKESMIHGYYKEGQTEEEFLKTSLEKPDFPELVNVGETGSHFGEGVDEGYKENADGTIKSKTEVYNMLYVESGEVDQPFRVSIVTKVKDYKTWKWLYDVEEKNRQNAGMKQLLLGVNKDDANEVFILIAIPDIAKAREMMEHPGLEKKMAQSGVIGKPIVKFWRPAGPQSEEL